MHQNSVPRNNDNATSTRHSSEDELENVLRDLCETYRYTITDNLIDIWERAFVGFTTSMLKLGLKATLQRHEDFMPTPAQFRKYYREAAEAEDFAGIRQEIYEEITQEEREAALEFSNKLKETLAQKKEELRVVYNPPRFDPVISEAFEIQLHNYRTWLAERVEMDRSDKAAGLLPIPRSESERLAMFLNLPAQERRRLARNKEWTKTLTKNM